MSIPTTLFSDSSQRSAGLLPAIMSSSPMIEGIISDSRAQRTEILHEELYPLPPPNNCSPRPLNDVEAVRVDTLSRLQFFLATAPTRWRDPDTNCSPSLHKFHLPSGESVSCVLWQGLFHITGTDIVRALAFRFEAFGRPVHSSKKWEEGVFSDLRNLKPGVDAALEEPKSPLLEFLFRNGCIRTQKKQKVFYWFSVPHDRLFLDALERDLKREKAGQEPTSMVVGEPAMSFRYDPRRTLYEQFAGSNPGLLSSGPPPVVTSTAPTAAIPPESNNAGSVNILPPLSEEESGGVNGSTDWHSNPRISQVTPLHMIMDNPRIFKQSLLPGSSEYKRRRSRSRQPSGLIQNTESSRALTPSFEENSAVLRAWTSSPRMVSSVQRLGDRPSNDVPSPLPRTYPCMYEDCAKRFKRLEHLKRHIRTHTNERPFMCPTCVRTFTRQDNLVQHLKTHQKVEPGTADIHSPAIIRRRVKRDQSPGTSVDDQSLGTTSRGLTPLPLFASSSVAFDYCDPYHRSFTAPPDQIGQVYPSPSDLRATIPEFMAQASDFAPYVSQADLRQTPGLTSAALSYASWDQGRDAYRRNENPDVQYR